MNRETRAKHKKENRNDKATSTNNVYGQTGFLVTAPTRSRPTSRGNVSTKPNQTILIQ